MRETLVSYEAHDYDNINGIEGLNFIYLFVRVFEDDKLVFEADYTPGGMLVEGEELPDLGNVTFHNNEDGEEYYLDEFVAKYVFDEKYHMPNEYGRGIVGVELPEGITWEGEE